jgi:hypothetical protein
VDNNSITVSECSSDPEKRVLRGIWEMSPLVAVVTRLYYRIVHEIMFASATACVRDLRTDKTSVSGDSNIQMHKRFKVVRRREFETGPIAHAKSLNKDSFGFKKTATLTLVSELGRTFASVSCTRTLHKTFIQDTRKKSFGFSCELKWKSEVKK